jgi:hypothetical protein
MDATQLSPLLAPLLPYLLKGGIELAKSAAGELGKKLSAEAWDGLKRLAEKIQQKAKAKPALREALTDAANAPTDEDALAALRLQLKKLLAEDPALAAEAARLLGTSVNSVVKVRDVRRGGKVTGVKSKGESPAHIHIHSEVEARDVSGEVTGVEISED